MRLLHSYRNFYIAVFTQLIMIFLGFLSRKIFIVSLGDDYLGINSIMTNVIALFGLVESGIGASITFSLYKPLAENNRKKVITLMQLYKKIYFIIAIIISIISIICYPIVLNLFTSSKINLTTITSIYFIFLFKNLLSYLFTYKFSLIIADQKQYILSQKNLIFSIITVIAKIVILKVTSNYIMFLLIEIILTLLQYSINTYMVNKLYPYIKTTNKYKLDKNSKEIIINKVKALFLHNIGTQIVFGTDNILISIFVNVKTVGLYSNYTLILNQVSSFINIIGSSIDASVGNLIAIESKQKIFEVFQQIFFLSFWIYCFCTTSLYLLLKPFIVLWIGDKYVFSDLITFIILINFYISGMRMSVLLFKRKAGLFEEDKIAPLIEAIINLLASIILLKWFGFVGVFLGTLLSTLLVPFWIQPKIIYRKLFNKPLILYFKKYSIYLVSFFITLFIAVFIESKLKTSNVYIDLILRSLIAIIIPNFIICLMFFKTSEFKYLVSSIKFIINNRRSNKKDGYKSISWKQKS